MNIQKIFCRYCHDISGSILITVAPFIIVIVLLIGGFIDFGRGNINRSETLGAIDAAALAAAAVPDEFVFGDADRIAVAERYYNYNVQNILDNKVAFPDLNVTINANGSVIDVAVDAVNSIDTTFLKASQIDAISTSGSTRVIGPGAVASVMDADIVIVGDLSVSMKYCDDRNVEGDCPDTNRMRGTQIAEKTALLLEKIYPLTDEADRNSARVETDFVRTGFTTYKGSNSPYAYYGKAGNSHSSFPGDSLRASFGDAKMFLDGIMGNIIHWSGATNGSAGMESAISLFEKAPIRSDGVKNSPVKMIVFLTDGWMWKPCDGNLFDCSDSRNPQVLQYAAQRFLEQCNRARQQDIIVITIAYGPAFLGASTAEVNFDVHAALRGCASEYVNNNGQQRSRYYVATDSVMLEDVMTRVIPESLTKLRIVK